MARLASLTRLGVLLALLPAALSAQPCASAAESSNYHLEYAGKLVPESPSLLPVALDHWAHPNSNLTVNLYVANLGWYWERYWQAGSDMDYFVRDWAWGGGRGPSMSAYHADVVGCDRQLVYVVGSDGVYVTPYGTPASFSLVAPGGDGVAVDSDGYLYVSDPLRDVIRIYERDPLSWRDHTEIAQVSLPFHPLRMTVHESNGSVDLYVVDPANDRVRKYARSALPVAAGDDLLTWVHDLGDGVVDLDDGYPIDVDTDAGGFVYVLQVEPSVPINRVQKYSQAGAFVCEWEDTGQGPGQIWNAMGIAVDDRNGDVYVADSGLSTGCIHTLRAVAAPSNLDPVAVVAGSVEAEGTSPAGALVSLDGTDSNDADGDPLTFEWSGTSITFDDPTSSTPTAIFPFGVTPVTLTVRDGRGGVATAEALVTVVDTTPPVAACAADRVSLWPANHKMVSVTITLAASDVCTRPADLVVTCTVASDEPDDGRCDARTKGDVGGQDGFQAPVAVALTWSATAGVYVGVVDLRAEHKARGDGRTYTIRCEAADVSGNETETSCTVLVPHGNHKYKHKHKHESRREHKSKSKSKGKRR